MRILHFYRTYYPDTQGGLEEAIRQICLSTGPLATENRVLTLQRKPGEATVERKKLQYTAPQDTSASNLAISASLFYRNIVS